MLAFQDNSFAWFSPVFLAIRGPWSHYLKQAWVCNKLWQYFWVFSTAFATFFLTILFGLGLILERHLNTLNGSKFGSLKALSKMSNFWPNNQLRIQWCIEATYYRLMLNCIALLLLDSLIVLWKKVDKSIDSKKTIFIHFDPSELLWLALPSVRHRRVNCFWL